MTLHSLWSSLSPALLTCSFLRPQISTLSSFLCTQLILGSSFFFLLRNDPPKLFHIEFLFSKLFKHVLLESFILAFSHLLSSIIVLKVKNLDSTIRRIGS